MGKHTDLRISYETKGLDWPSDCIELIKYLEEQLLKDRLALSLQDILYDFCWI